jgi:hypothetical protein
MAKTIVETVSPTTPISVVHQNSDDYWAFSEGSGTTIDNDNGSTTAEFDTIDSWINGTGFQDYYLDVPSGGEGELGTDSQSEWSHFVNTGEGSVGCWIKPDGAGQQMIIGSGVQANENGVRFAINSSGEWGVRIYNGSSSVVNFSGGSAQSGVWQSFAYTAYSGTGYIVVDGSQIASDSLGTTSSGDLDDTVSLAGQNSDAQTTTGFAGGFDNAFHNSSGFTVSEIIDWHNSVDHLY